MTDFRALHPLTQFIYFVVILSISMASYNPFIIGISILGAIFYNIYIGKSVKSILAVIPLMVVVAVLNPVFSHKGATILFYWGNPITLESILYGICTAFMLFGVILWFGIFNYTMTSDKIVYIFGKVLPKGSLIVSMTLRLVPRLKLHLNTILESQRAMGKDIKTAKFKDKIVIGGKAISALISWVLEGALVTSDSMQARGYGKKGRTNYSIFTFTLRDKIFMFVTLLFAFVVMYGFISEALRFEFYPVIYMESFYCAIPYYIVFIVIAFLPFIYDFYEVSKWKLLKSKI